jgi:tRNA nucleotidyltransferase (CCA-adding enzyme)
MKIIIGHSNMDLDCIGSMVLARYLFPDHQPVASRYIHPVARPLYNLFADRLGFLPVEQLKGQSVKRVVVVDTRVLRRVEEFLWHLSVPASGQPGADLVVFDHHSGDTSDIPGAVIRERPVGANTTLLGLELLRRSVTLDPDDATIALTGIYADTGNFTHENVQYADFQVASLCLQSGASLKLVRSFLRPLREEHQLALFHEALNRLTYRNYAGHLVLLVFLELERQVPGLAAVAEQVFEVEGPDALFAVFALEREKQCLIVARSRGREIDLLESLAPFGAGGHALAASATLKDRPGRAVFEELERHLAQALRPAPTAASLMQREPCTLRLEQTLADAAETLERAGRSGAPVLNGEERLEGYLSRQDIQKGKRASQMHAPVRAYMIRKVITVTPGSPLREIGQLFAEHPVASLPVVEAGRLAGLVTRADYLRLVEERRLEDRDFLDRLRAKSRGEPVAGDPT